MSEMVSVMNKTVIAAKNFPITTLVTEIGAVRNIWSVLVFLSSAKLFIVNIGVIRMST